MRRRIAFEAVALHTAAGSKREESAVYGLKKKDRQPRGLQTLLRVDRVVLGGSRAAPFNARKYLAENQDRIMTTRAFGRSVPWRFRLVGHADPVGISGFELNVVHGLSLGELPLRFGSTAFRMVHPSHLVELLSRDATDPSRVLSPGESYACIGRWTWVRVLRRGSRSWYLDALARKDRDRVLPNDSRIVLRY